MSESGRNVWWVVLPIDAAGPACVTYIGKALVSNAKMMELEHHIVQRAHEGCPDCISAILECPEDVSLQVAVNSYLPKEGKA